jgi:hypothetical protein
MSIQTYAVVNNLPPPVTSGSGIQNFTDEMTGEVWVAKVGVISGQWRKARDVLHGIAHRSAVTAMSTSTAGGGANVPYDTTDQDAYGMNTGAANYGWTAPIPGWYRAFATITVTVVTTANTFIQGSIAQTTPLSVVTLWSSDNWWSTTTSGNMTWRSMALMYLGALDMVNVHAYNAQGFNYVASATYTRFEFDYLGTG